ncbi:hypothetical protein [Aeromonas hydrophila]|uniref:Uncharacterized protein n=2 Tax=Aeromonas hydrophila TaxID=644 RepID=A0A346ACS1_AERHY|nr:hypothetical protein [Aeromonas hydrophila]AXL05033.1 hypothetical protein [Aeromonas hydrophila]
MMTNSVNYVVKSSKLGAVTQCGSRDIFEGLNKKTPADRSLLLSGKVLTSLLGGAVQNGAVAMYC